MLELNEEEMSANLKADLVKNNVFMYSKYTDEQLQEAIELAENQIGELEYKLGKLQNESFYRKFPESRK